MAVDLLLQGGLAVLPTGSVHCDLGIADGVIVSLTTPGLDTPAAREKIDVSGKILVPGGIDPHVHASWTVPTAAKAGITSGDAELVSRAAAYGGTTTLVDFASWEQGESLHDSVARKQGEYDGSSYVDYALHCILRGDLPQKVVDEIPALIASGFPSLKVFLTQTTPNRPSQMMGMGQVSEVIERAAGKGIVAVHAEDDDIVMFNYRRLREQGKYGVAHMAEAHNPLSEAVALERLIAVARRVGGAIYIMHVSSSEGVEVVRQARAAGLPVYAETLQHYLCFTADAYKRDDGPLFHTYPSLKWEGDRLALWEALADGTVSTVATDELCTSREVKMRGTTIEDTTGGHAGVEVRLPIMYGESVERRGHDLLQYVDMTSANAARILGMYPKKGALDIGSDGDIAVLDTSEPWKLSLTKLHESDYSIWEGWTVPAKVTMTLVRGQVVMRDGELTGTTGSGRVVHREIRPRVMRGPRV